MKDIVQQYGIPQELMAFIDSGFLQVVAERDEEKTIEFHAPSLRRRDRQRRITTFSLVWIHPNFNGQFCHYYDEKPGDQPNFYVSQDTSDLGDEQLDLNSLDELVDWLDLAAQAV